MIACCERLGDATSGIKLDAVALTVIERQAVAIETGIFGNRQHGRRIKTAREENDGALRRVWLRSVHSVSSWDIEKTGILRHPRNSQLLQQDVA